MLNKLIDKKVIKFLIVWVSSTAVDIWSLFFLYEIINLELYLAIFIAFLLSVINGFLLNKFWTFWDKSKSYKTQFFKFFIASSIWLLLTFVFMYIFIEYIWIYYIYSKIITTFIVVIWNYNISRLWTFAIKEDVKKIIQNFNYDTKYSIIVPAYNEEKRLWKTLKEINNYFKNKQEKYEIIVVDDGSKDETIKITQNIWFDVKIITYWKNRGKWFAVKKWILEAVWEYVIYTDADNSTPIEEFDKLLNEIKSWYDISIWSRYLKESKLEKKQPLHRIIISRAWNFLIQKILIWWFKDTQCWFKMFKNHVAKDVFLKQKTNWFWFDMEILLVSKTIWYSIKEVPVIWIDSPDSRLNPVKDMFKTLKELIIIKFNHLIDWYK